MGRAARAMLMRGAGFVGLLALGWAAFSHAQTPNLEYSVKANFLVRFAAFVEWPSEAFAGPEAPVLVCVIGRDPFGGVLDRAAAGQTAHGRPVVVQRPTSAEAAAACNILYLGQGSPNDAQPLTLTVTDQAVTSRRGMIHFVIVGGRVRFHIDRVAAEHGGVAISSRLLNLALSVQE